MYSRPEGEWYTAPEETSETFETPEDSESSATEDETEVDENAF
jgi:hypothetical protein